VKAQHFGRALPRGLPDRKPYFAFAVQFFSIATISLRRCSRIHFGSGPNRFLGKP